MKAIIVKHYFGQNVLEENKHLKDKLNLEVFNLSLLFPDAFSYPNSLASLFNKQGLIKTIKLKTKKPDEFFKNLVLEAKTNKLLQSFCYGYLVSFLLDTFLNPFIYYRTGFYDPRFKETQSYKNNYALYESILNAVFIRDFYQKDPHLFMTSELLLEKYKLNKALKYSLDKVYFKTFGVRSVFRNFNLALKRVKKYFLKTYDPKGKKTRIFSHFKKNKDGIGLDCAFLFGKENVVVDIFNEKNHKWFHPFSDEKRDESFWTLFNRALEEVNKKVKLLDAFFSEEKDTDLSLFLENRSAITGFKDSDEIKLCNYKNIFMEKEVKNAENN